MRRVTIILSLCQTNRTTHNPMPTFDRNERLSWYLNSVSVQLFSFHVRQLAVTRQGWKTMLNISPPNAVWKIICCFSSFHCLTSTHLPHITPSHSSVDFWLQIKLELKTYFLLFFPFYTYTGNKYPNRTNNERIEIKKYI